MTTYKITNTHQMTKSQTRLAYLIAAMFLFIAGIQTAKISARRSGDTYDVGYEQGYNDAGEAPRDAESAKIEVRGY